MIVLQQKLSSAKKKPQFQAVNFIAGKFSFPSILSAYIAQSISNPLYTQLHLEYFLCPLCFAKLRVCVYFTLSFISCIVCVCVHVCVCVCTSSVICSVNTGSNISTCVVCQVIPNQFLYFHLCSILHLQPSRVLAMLTQLLEAYGRLISSLMLQKGHQLFTASQFTSNQCIQYNTLFTISQLPKLLGGC